MKGCNMLGVSEYLVFDGAALKGAGGFGKDYEKTDLDHA